jgi:hypothetical protein
MERAAVHSPYVSSAPVVRPTPWGLGLAFPAARATFDLLIADN